MTLIYLAGAVDAVSTADAHDWRIKAQNDLGKLSVAAYSPPAAFSVPESFDDADAMARIIDINNGALRFSHAVLANLSGHSFGTPVEVWAALFDHKLPVFSWGISKRSIYRDLIRADGSYEEALANLKVWIAQRVPVDAPLAPAFAAPEDAVPSPNE